MLWPPYSVYYMLDRNTPSHLLLSTMPFVHNLVDTISSWYPCCMAPTVISLELNSNVDEMRSSSHPSFLLSPIQILLFKLTQPQHHSLEDHKKLQLHQRFINPVINGIGLTQLRLPTLISAYKDGTIPSNSFVLDTRMGGNVHPVLANKIP